jgi:hypothetical protein
MKSRGYWMQLFRVLERRLSAETDTARRERIARLLCKIEARIAAAHKHRTLAWIAYRNQSWYSERGGEFRWPIEKVYREPAPVAVAQTQAAA